MSPRSKKQFEAIRKQSRESIEQAAMELFARKGYANTSIAQIATEAGVSKGLLYNYYDGKDDLLRSIVMKAMDSGDHIMSESFDNAPEPGELIKGVVGGSYQLFKDNPAYWKLMISLFFQDEVLKEMHTLMMEKSKMGLDLITPVFTQLGYPNPRAQAFLFGAAMDGVFLQSISLGNEDHMEEMMNYIIETFSKPYRNDT